MSDLILKKDVFSRWVREVMKSNEFIAPVSGNPQKTIQKSHYRKIESPDEIFLNQNTFYPIKNFFSGEEEVLFEFKGDNILVPKLHIRNRVFFGIRRCDLNSIRHQDMVFMEEHPDLNYKVKREASVLIGYHCKETGPYCFCQSFDLKEFFDLMFHDKGDSYAVEIGSDKGGKFVRQ